MTQTPDFHAVSSILSPSQLKQTLSTSAYFMMVQDMHSDEARGSILCTWTLGLASQ
jgi:hypothetical protein